MLCAPATVRCRLVLSPRGARAFLLQVLAARDLPALWGVLGDSGAAAREALAPLEALLAYAEAGGFGEWLVLDASMVRGLAYYTGTVFEAFDRSGALRAVAGGGRYDSLLTASFGAPEPMAACGFGLGDAVVLELLSAKGLLPDDALLRRSGSAQVVVAALAVGDDGGGGDSGGGSALMPASGGGAAAELGGALAHGAAMQVAAQLRAQGARVDCVLGPRKGPLGTGRVLCRCLSKG